MKTITRTLTVYTAAELKVQFPSGFEKARQEYIDACVNSDSGVYSWPDTVISDFLTIAALMGFSVDRDHVQWSGFGSQGDGASFTGSAVFDPDALKKVQDYAPQDTELHRIASECGKYAQRGLEVKISRICHHYNHNNTVAVDAWALGEEDDYNPLDKTPHGPNCWNGWDVQETCRSLMQWLYRQLEKEYEYRAGGECFLETAEANEWTFTAEGEMENE